MPDLSHFHTAQAPIYPIALAELRAGDKRSHWMWFIFPQIAGLGRSPMAQRFALQSLGEARAYLADPVLGARYRECVSAVLPHAGERSVHDIFGSPDDLKFHSSLTLFHRAAPDDPLFKTALETFFDGLEDPGTLDRL
jgi:uncharacterized protein (DUF1810 family)